MRNALLVLLLLAAVGCGGSPAGPSTPQPYSTSVAGNVAVFGRTYDDMSCPRAGVMTLRLSWNTSADLDLYVVNSNCNVNYMLSTCQIMAAANGSVNPETITRSVTAGETYRVVVDNMSLSQSVNYTLSMNIQ